MTSYLVSSLAILGISAVQGLDFVAVGDYGAASNLTRADFVFDKINEKKLDFIMTAGDNVYPQVSEDPQQWEFDAMMSLFQRDNLKSVPVYPTRGNHDCYFDWPDELKLTKEYDNWNFETFFYKKEFEVGSGKKLGVVFVDSCFMVCSTYNFNNQSEPYNDGQEYFNSCDEERTKLGNLQYEFLLKTAQEWESDPSIIFKASVQHYPMWGPHYDDVTTIINNYLPILMEYKFDLYISGHEHLLVYENHPFTTTDYKPRPLLNQGSSENCVYNTAIYYNNEVVTEKTYTQGEYIHQITSGAAGRDPYDMCLDKPQTNAIMFAENEYNGYALFHVDETAITVRYMSVIEEEESEVYRVNILRPDSAFLAQEFTQ